MSYNTWLHRLVRPAVRPLIRTRVTPNHLTTLRLVSGLAATAALAEGSETSRALGAGIFLVSMMLDRCDGELARMGGKTTPWGHKYDLVADAACNTLIFVGLGIGLRNASFGAWAVVMGATAGVAVAIVLWLTVRMEQRYGARSAEPPGAGGFDSDDAMLVVPAAVWMGMAQPLLSAAVIGAPAFAMFLYLRLRRALAAPDTGAAN